ncbi:MAG: hypothetical protein AAB285_09360, partial [candidate division NC10 bacterium]
MAQQKKKTVPARKKSAAVRPAKRPVAARHKFLLDERDLPTRWYNIQADLRSPLPPVIHPGTMKPIGPQDLAP